MLGLVIVSCHCVDLSLFTKNVRVYGRRLREGSLLRRLRRVSQMEPCVKMMSGSSEHVAISETSEQIDGPQPVQTMLRLPRPQAKVEATQARRWSISFGVRTNNRTMHGAPKAGGNVGETRTAFLTFRPFVSAHEKVVVSLSGQMGPSDAELHTAKLVQRQMCDSELDRSSNSSDEIKGGRVRQGPSFD